MDVYAFFTAFAGLLYVFMAFRFLSLKKESAAKFLFSSLNLLLFIIAFSLFFAFYTTVQQTQLLLFQVAVTGWLVLPLLMVGLAIPFSQKYRKHVLRLLAFVLFPVALALIASFNSSPFSIMNIYMNSIGLPVYSFDPQSYWHYLLGLYFFLAGSITLWLLLRLNKTIFPYVSQKQKWQARLIILPVPFFYLPVIFFDIVLPGMQMAVLPNVTHLLGLPALAALFYSATMFDSNDMIWEELSGIFIQRIKQLIFFLDSRGEITYVNRFGAELLNYPLHEIAGKPAASFFRQPLALNKLINMAGFVHDNQKETMYLLPHNDNPVPLAVNVVKVPGKVYEKSGYVLIGLDIREKVFLQSRVNERIRVEARLQSLSQNLERRVASRQDELVRAKKLLDKEVASRQEAEKKLIREVSVKEEMLREIHHRVKNNIQLVISLINIVSGQDKVSEDLRKVYLHLAKRIRDVSYIHDYFYDLPSMGRVNFNHFIRKTTNELKSRRSKGQQIQFKLVVTEQPLTVKQAIPCGIVVYELLTNVIDHAFPESEAQDNPVLATSTVNVEFNYTEPLFQLNVKDNGIGLPLQKGQPEKEGLGLNLVHTIVKEDLKGDIAIDNYNGTNIKICFRGDPVNTD